MKILFIHFLLFFFKPINGFSCTCIPQTIEEAYSSADEIFIGKILKIDTLLAIDSAYRVDTEATKYQFLLPRKMIVTRFKVLNTIKGREALEFISVYTSYGCCTCGFYFRPNGTYIVYASSHLITISKDRNVSWEQKALIKVAKETKQAFFTSSCLRTTRNYKDEIQQLTDLLKPDKSLTYFRLSRNQINEQASLNPEK